jgi:hypothetical protein
MIWQAWMDHMVSFVLTADPANTGRFHHDVALRGMYQMDGFGYFG